MNTEFEIGDKVCKAKGYHYVGEVVGKYKKTTGETRYDIEFVGIGMLHIFGNELIKLDEFDYNYCKDMMGQVCSYLDDVRSDANEKHSSEN